MIFANHWVAKKIKDTFKMSALVSTELFSSNYCTEIFCGKVSNRFIYFHNYQSFGKEQQECDLSKRKEEVVKII